MDRPTPDPPERAFIETPKPPPEAYLHARDNTITPAPGPLVSRRQGEEKDTLGRRKGTIRQESGGWIYAPVSSHLSRFMFEDQGVKAQIHVVFKGPEGRGEVAEYSYSFDDADRANEIFMLMRSSPHPYGSVLRPMVILAGIPYTPRAIRG